MARLTKTAMRAEAVERMEKLGICQLILEQFRETGRPAVCEGVCDAFIQLDQVELAEIRRLEKLHNVIIYTGIRTWTQIGLMDSYLYVSGWKRDWEFERQCLETEMPSAVVVNWDDPGRIDMGSIGIAKTENGGLERTW